MESVQLPEAVAGPWFWTVHVTSMVSPDWAEPGTTSTCSTRRSVGGGASMISGCALWAVLLVLSDSTTTLPRGRIGRGGSAATNTYRDCPARSRGARNVRVAV